MLTDATVQARRNPGALSPARINRSAYGPFCDAVRRLGCLTPTQKLLAWLLAQATLRQGYTSLAYRSLTELTQVRPQAKPFAGLGKNDLSPALNALKHFGLVTLEERATLESGVPPVTLLLVIADATQWAVPADGWLFSAEEEQEVMVHLLACRRRWTAQLPELAEDADLCDARAAVAVEAAASHAPVEPDNRDRSACRVGAFVRPTGDAPELCRTKAMPCVAPRRSESRNAETPTKARCVPKVGTPIEIERCETETEIKLPIGSVAQPADLKLAIAEGDEREFCAAACVVMGRRDWEDGRPHNPIGDGSKWRMRFRHQPSRAKVRAVFLDMLERGQAGGAVAEFRWKQFGGQALDASRLKFFKESL